MENKMDKTLKLFAGIIALLLVITFCYAFAFAGLVSGELFGGAVMTVVAFFFKNR